MKQCFYAVIALVLFPAATGLAQQNTPPDPSGARHTAEPAITTDEPGGLIHLDAIVTDPSGAPVSGLRLEDFTLLDNGQPTKILAFNASDAKPDPPSRPIQSRLILVLDAIDLDGLSAELARNESVAFQRYLRRNGGHLTRPVSVFLINDRGLWTVENPDGDGNTMADDILHNQLKLIRPFRDSQLTPSINLAHDSPAVFGLKSIAQIATAERRDPGRKIMVWVGPSWGLGPGLYNASRTKENPLDTKIWFSTLLREARIVFFSLAVAQNDPRAGKYADPTDEVNTVNARPRANDMSWDRKQLALESGGLAYEATFDIAQQIASSVRDADSFYTLTFDPAHADAPNEYHDLKIVIHKPGLTARTNAGYYDHAWYGIDRYPAAHTLTVQQLEQMLSAGRSTSDAEFARQLSSSELTERLSEAKLLSLETAARGKRTREALQILADVSAFLDPPPDEILPTAPPDADAQRHMLSLTEEYLSTTIHKLPNYIAERTTARYQETPQFAPGSFDASFDASSDASSRISFDTAEPRQLHLTDTLTSTVYYREGSEVADPPKSHGHRERGAGSVLATYGTFGPLLAGVLNAIHRHTDLVWIRWEQGTSGPVAVFRYSIPAELSHYQVQACCLTDGDGRSLFSHFVGYHGQIAIDPQTGAVLSLEYSAAPKSTTPAGQSKILIQYAPVDIGGVKYICPVRSISLLRARSVAHASAWDESFLTYGPYATMLNEIEFSKYRHFGSAVRILPGFTPAPDDK